MHRRRRHLALAIATLAGLVSSIAPSTPTAAADMGGWFKPGVPFGQTHPDPSIVDLGPMTFSFATNHGGPKLPVSWSADSTTWTARTQYPGSGAFQGGDTHGWYSDALPAAPWGYGSTKELWAPSVAQIGSRWVAFHTVRIAPPGSYSAYGRFAIYVSTAPEATGPYTAVSSTPIVTTNTTRDPAGAIDPDVYVDEVTGKAYLLWKTEGNLSGNYPAIWSRQLDSAGTGFASGSTSRKLLTVSQGWEGKVVENPSLTKVNGRFILLYSGNEFRSASYATGWASCKGPLGPCTKSSGNPILRSASGAYGPGGADGLMDSRGRFIAVYHASTSSGWDQGQRRQYVAELSTEGGALRVIRRKLQNGAGPDSAWFSAKGGGHTSKPFSVGGTYVPAAGDFDGNGRDDIYWYGAWNRSDVIWSGQGNRTFANRSADQAGSLVPLAGDFDGNGRDDIYWYGPGADPKAADPHSTGSDFEPLARNDEMWLSTGTGWTKRRMGNDWTANPIVGDFDGNGATDILWARPGAAADTIWFFSGGNYRSVRVSVSGNYRPVVGDFDGNGVDDVFWYGPGSRTDSIWWFTTSGSHTTQTKSVSGDRYRPFAGDFDGDGRDDLFWYAPGTSADYLWRRVSRSGHTSVSRSVSGTYQAIVGDYDGNGADDVFWHS